MNDLEITRVAFMIVAGTIGLVMYFTGRYTGWYAGQQALYDEADRYARSLTPFLIVEPFDPDDREVKPDDRPPTDLR